MKERMSPRAVGYLSVFTKNNSYFNWKRKTGSTWQVQAYVSGTVLLMPTVRLCYRFLVRQKDSRNAILLRRVL